MFATQTPGQAERKRLIGEAAKRQDCDEKLFKGSRHLYHDSCWCQIGLHAFRNQIRFGRYEKHQDAHWETEYCNSAFCSCYVYCSSQSLSCLKTLHSKSCVFLVLFSEKFMSKGLYTTLIGSFLSTVTQSDLYGWLESQSLDKTSIMYFAVQNNEKRIE